MGKYTLVIAAFLLTACSEGRKTPDGYEMDNPPPSAYAPSDYESFDPDKYNADTDPVKDDANITGN